MAVIRDINGREVKPGDLVRLRHYVDTRTGRFCYMYKIVMRGTDGFKIDPQGECLFGVDVCDVAAKHSVGDAHKYLINHQTDGIEVIDGQLERKADGSSECWYERPKVKTPATTNMD